MSEVIQARMDNVGDAFKFLLDDMGESSKKEVNKFFNKMPGNFQRKAKKFFTKVLKVRSGNLRRSIKGFKKKQGTQVFEIGLMAGGEVAQYAQIQHEGGYIRPHIIRVRVAGALRWYGGARTKGGNISKAKGNVRFAKSVRHPGGYIRATKFLQFPMLKESEKQLEILATNIIVGSGVVKSFD